MTLSPERRAARNDAFRDLLGQAQRLRNTRDCMIVIRDAAVAQPEPPTHIGIPLSALEDLLLLAMFAGGLLHDGLEEARK